MIEFILTFGCVLLLCTGIGIVSWAVADMCTENPNIKNTIMVIFGIGVVVFGIFYITKASIYYKEGKRV